MPLRLAERSPTRWPTTPTGSAQAENAARLDALDLPRIELPDLNPPVDSASSTSSRELLPAPETSSDISRPRRRALSTSTRSCATGRPGSSSPAAAAASARRRRPPRWRCSAAEAGRRTVVLTIDPARRLAQSMGLTELDNTPRAVKGVDESRGRLFAMMLDMKRTFDDVVSSTPRRNGPSRSSPTPSTSRCRPPSPARRSTWRWRSWPAGRADEWDLIVVDTPPSRSALDFLDAPNRLGRFLDGRMIRLLTAPARAGGKAYLKVVTAGVSVFSGVFTKVLGGELLRDLSSFVSALESMFGGFRERAQHTYELLKAPGTAFVVVAAPEPDALREASYFVERLRTSRCRSPGWSSTGCTHRRARRRTASLTAPRAEAAAERSPRSAAATRRNGGTRTRGRSALAETALRVHAELAAAAEHDARMTRRFAAAHPDVAVVSVPALPADVHDLDGLREIGGLLAS